VDIQIQTMAGKFQSIQVGDEVAPPRLQSYLFWKDIFEEKIPEYLWMPRIFRQNGYVFPGSHSSFMTAQRALYGEDWCALCDGLGTRRDPDGYYYCLCHLLSYRESMIRKAEPWITKSWSRRSLSEIEIVGSNTGQIQSLESMVRTMATWMDNPNKHVVLSGSTGVGKSHVLNAIVTKWYPWFVLLVASDFENMLRGGLSDNTVQKMMEVWSNHPGLLFDDLGIEYASPWITQKLEDLIEFRTRKSHWWDTITVFSTNLRRNEIKQKFTRDGVSRIGSRLTDTESVIWIGIDAMDYRNRKRE
jgi:DNA replication protein DnaC